MKSLELGRPLAATLLLGAMVTLAALALAGGWADLSSAEAERDAKADFVSRSVQAVRAEEKTGTREPVQLHVVANSETLAAAQVDALVRATVAQAGGSVLSSRADAKHDEEGPEGRIEVQAVIEAPNDALQSLLLKIESGKPMMLIEDASIQPASSGGADAAENTAPRLHATLTLSAFWQSTQK